NNSDPLELGVVGSVSRPGSNVTGFAATDVSLSGKWLQLLKEIAPATTNVLLLAGPTSGPGPWLSSAEVAAGPLGISVVAHQINSESSIESVLAEFARQPNTGVI